MAERGKPLPFGMKQEIRQRRTDATVRAVARELQVSKSTVQKYGNRSLVQGYSNGMRNR